MSRTARPYLAALPLLLAACATAGAAPEPARVTVRQLESDAGNFRIEATSPDATATAALPFPADQAWKALPAVYTRLGMTGAGVLDEAGRVYGQRQAAVRRRLGGTPLSMYLDCGSAVPGVPNADTYSVTLTVQTRVQEAAGGGSTVATRVDAHAIPAAGSTLPVRCTSNNVLEQRIHDLLAAP